MKAPFRRIANFSSRPLGAKIVLSSWIILALILTFILPSAGDYAVNSDEGSIKADRPSEIATQLKEEAFPTDDGLPALLVVHEADKISDENKDKITQLSEWFASDEKPEYISSALPYHQFPEQVQQKMYSEDETTLLFNITLKDGVDSDQINETLQEIQSEVDTLNFENVQFEITGPAGIAADTIGLFKDADFVLMLATVVLIFLLLIIIYRSPVLAITPLLIAGIVYAVVDRLLGLSGKLDLFTIDSSATSIMLVLLFAVITDYSLFVFSRYREELEVNESKYKSMQEAIYHVSEPIFFSGGTIFLAMLTLFTTVFKPYNHFAAVFAVAVVVILIAGLTLIPSIFTLMGRKAFWPFVPKVKKEKTIKKGLWAKVGKLVNKHPAVIATSLLIVLGIGIFSSTQIKFSFDLMNSFPDDISSKEGFEILKDHYPEGELAPVTILLDADKKIDEATLEHIQDLQADLKDNKNIHEVNSVLSDDMVSGEADLPREFLSDDEKTVQFDFTLNMNPYDTSALDTVKDLKDSSEKLLSDNQLSTKDFSLHYSGQTAEQLDIREMNQRDMIFLFTIVTVLLTLVIGFQTRSVILPILMMTTIVLSYFAILGFSWLIFTQWMGFDAISYRLPLYTFVFMVALGIDYNIMLVSRIRELAKHMPWREAVGEGIHLTGGVISSAGIILAATFGVLMTQPLQELFLFGFTMAIGVIADTFFIRGLLLPSLLTFLYRKKDSNKKKKSEIHAS